MIAFSSAPGEWTVSGAGSFAAPSSADTYFRCEGEGLRELVFRLTLGGCQDSMASVQVECTDSTSVKLAALAESRARWAALEAELGSSYWYQEQNCGAPNPVPRLNTIQVTDQSAVNVASASLLPSWCVGVPNRFGAIPVTTLPGLYDYCEDLVRSDDTTSVSFDDEGVIRGCHWDGYPMPNCFDACGYGFLLTARGFGTYAAPASCGGLQCIPDFDQCFVLEPDALGELESCEEICTAGQCCLLEDGEWSAVEIDCVQPEADAGAF